MSLGLIVSHVSLQSNLVLAHCMHVCMRMLVRAYLNGALFVPPMAAGRTGTPRAD